MNGVIKQNVDKKRWLTLSQIQGHIAMWAVRQSPYDCPEGLDQVLIIFRQSCEHLFDQNSMAQFDGKDVSEIIRAHLLTVPYVQQWNERKNKRQGHGFVTRYPKPSPDDDFIDLDALRMNVVCSLFRELEYDDGWGQR